VQPDPITGAASPASRIADALLDMLGTVPSSSEAPHDEPHARSRELSRRAARKAAIAAGSLALPPGALGWLTILPELATVWRLQAQMVADIAGVHGTEATLTREHMLYCLFRHTAAQGVRDLVVRMGQRVLVQQATQSALQHAAGQVGIRLTRHAIGRGVARWVPVAGAIGVGAYAYYDTLQVGFTASRLFQRPPPPRDVPRLLLPRH
jgi:hypothetical protein